MRVTNLVRWLAGALVVATMAAVTPALADGPAAAIVIRADTGAILYSDNIDLRRPPASLAKMMTLYMTFESMKSGKLKPEQQLPVSRHAAAQVPTKLGLRAGETITVKDAIMALVTQSANDAAVVLAEAQGGTESAFAASMTKRARQIGMAHTTFKNASGLNDKEQVSTAYDLARLGQSLIRDFPQYYPYFSVPKFTYRGTTYNNHNGMLGNYPGADGLKTGYVAASGYNLTASAVRGRVRLVGVVLGENSPRARDQSMTQLFDQAFQKLALNEKPGTKPNTTTAQAPAVKAPTTTAAKAPVPAAAPSAPAKPGTIMANAAAPPPPTRGGWAVQVGAYRDYTRAENQLLQATRALPNGAQHAPVILPGTSTKDPIYRARLGGFNEADARDACRVLGTRGISCVTVAPDTQTAELAEVGTDGDMTTAAALPPGAFDPITEVRKLLLPR